MIVADTNLVVYLAVPEARAQAARAVRLRDPDWVAPPLWASEFRNALVQHVRHDRLTAEQARDVWAASRDLVREVDVDPLHALGVAVARGLSGYDAEFVALAETLGVPLVTDDRRMLSACPGTAVALDDFGTASRDSEPDAPGR